MKDTSRYLLLAGANGILSSLTLAVIERIANYYADIQRGQTDYILQWQSFWNVTTMLFNVAVVLFAAVVVRRFFVNNGRLISFWMVAALVVITCWGLTWVIVIVVSSIAAGHSPVEKILEAIIFRSSQRAALGFVAVVLCVNVSFGAVVHIAASYARRR